MYKIVGVVLTVTHRIHVFLGLLDPDPDLDPLVRGIDPDPDPDLDPSNGSGSTGSTCFWASWIRIRIWIHWSEVWIRIQIRI
jgi:hypothetical protein